MFPPSPLTQQSNKAGYVFFIFLSKLFLTKETIEKLLCSVFIPGWGWGQHFFESRTGQADGRVACEEQALFFGSVIFRREKSDDRIYVRGLQGNCIGKAVLLSSVNKLSWFGLRFSCCLILFSNLDSAVSITRLKQQAVSNQKNTNRHTWRSSPVDSAFAFHFLKE